MGRICSPFEVTLRISNKLNTLERLLVQVDLCEDFIITAPTLQVVEVYSICSLILSNRFADSTRERNTVAADHGSFRMWPHPLASCKTVFGKDEVHCA